MSCARSREHSHLALLAAFLPCHGLKIAFARVNRGFPNVYLIRPTDQRTFLPEPAITGWLREVLAPDRFYRSDANQAELWADITNADETASGNAERAEACSADCASGGGFEPTMERK